ncbi:MAG TPA: NAD(P)/FAD-dependent oxidoreductase, partial [Chitinophagales bacterium]|nr:NAD(P)/FAD-dependent oxidoreductase [Chitinophagales bacterium]
AAFEQPVETGAEFVHGKLPITLSLLKEYGIPVTPAKGEMWQCYNGQFSRQDDFIEYANLLDKPLKDLHSDITVAEFLESLPNDDKHEELKFALQEYIEGYDAADVTKASALAFKHDWLHQDEKQFRVEGGYARLIEAIANECRSNACRIVNGVPVKTITWKKGNVSITTGTGEQFSAQCALITVPLGILQLPATHSNAIKFVPALPDKTAIAEEMGFGAVIKILLQFDHAWWVDEEVRKRSGHKLDKMEFLFTDTRISTWWTQHPHTGGLLTGWIGGPPAQKMSGQSNKDILDEALQALAYMFQLPQTQLEGMLKGWHVANWGADEYAHGAYSYTTVNWKEQKKILSAPVEGTLFFAGEALYSGEEISMVEGALGSGLETAAEILHLPK